MTDWTAGYRTDIEYTQGYYGELNPLRARFALTNAGIVCPAFKTACELGFGQGLSVNIHAAAAPTAWYGNDFNASQVANAQEMAEAAEAGAMLTDDSFAEFAKRKDLPDFDYIGLHGVWSWVSEANRRVIVEFIRRKLKPGGIVYLGYNSMAGFAGFEPVRHMMIEHAKVLGTKGRGIKTRVKGAVDFMGRTLATNPPFAKLNAVAVATVKAIQGKNQQYLAHEYFNEDWHPMHFAKVAELLHEAKLEFACSAHYMDHLDETNFTAEQQQLLKEIPDTVFREGMKEFMLHQRFRKDFWVKGGRRLSAAEQRQRLRRLRFVMMALPSRVPAKLKCIVGEASLDKAIYGPVLELMQDHVPRTLGEIEQAVAGFKLTLTQIKDAVLVLAGLSVFAPVQEAAVVAKARSHTDNLNLHLLHRALENDDNLFLASPVTGGGVLVSRMQQLFLLARHAGKKTPALWADHARQALAEQDQKLVRQGKVVATPQETLAVLTADAEEFAKGQLLILKKLQVVR
ncbi:MAG: methyltransferase regulatory domain-containing protein [Pseudomonadota bacterium]